DVAPATVELSVPVAIPLGSVAAEGCVNVLPSPVAARVTALFLIRLPYWSRAVTVIVLALLPVDALIVAGAATTVVRAASTAPGTVKAVKLRADPTPVACAVCVLSIGVIAVPSVQLVDAMPLELVLEVSGLTEPPPSTTDQLTVTPATGLLSASATRTDKGTGSVWPTVSVWPCPPLIAIRVAPPTCPTWLSPENFARVAAGPAVPVAVNVTGLPVRPAALAVRVLAPAVVPRVQVPTVAMPLEFVVCSAPVTLPPPDAGANVTLTP